jgi:hypothetical protein
MIPDYNRDRVIDDTDRQSAMNGDTFYFWINDDDDQGETGGDDITLVNTYLHGDSRNFFNSEVDGVRDLIDFFPVYLDLKDLLAVYPLQQYTYRLKTGGEHFNLVFTRLKPEEAGYYLVGDWNKITSSGFNNLKPVLDLGSAPTVKVVPDGDVFTSQEGGITFLTEAQKDGKGVILLEGRSTFKGNLRLEVSDGLNTLFHSELNLSIDGVEQMFRHVNLVQEINNPNAAPTETGNVIGEHYAQGGERNRLTVDDFTNKEHFSGYEGECADKYLVMLHGFKVNGQAARGWHSEIFKRMFWSGSRAKFVGVSWFGFENIPDYHSNVVNAFKTAEIFGQKLYPAVGRSPVTIMAHSLGNIVVSSYLTDYYPLEPAESRLNINNYLLLNAAVAIEAYLGDYKGYAEGKLNEIFGSDNPMVHTDWYGYQKRLGVSEWHQLFNGGSDSRLKLTWRDRFKEIKGVNLINLYSQGEDVLDTHEGDTGTLEVVSDTILHDGRHSWVYQEKWKGRAPVGGLGGTTTMGWGFNFNDGYYYMGHHVEPPVANTYDSQLFMAAPFFLKDPSKGFLFTQRMGLVVDDIERNEILSNQIPSLTLPTGGREGGDVNSGEFIELNMLIDMNEQKYKNGWPSVRENEDWRHSDIKTIAYPYTYRVFEKIKQSGEL